MGPMSERLDRFMQSRARWLLQLAVGPAASLGLAWLVARSVNWSHLVDLILDFNSIRWALLALIPLVGGALMRAVRWKVLLHRDRVSFFSVFLTQNTGIGLNNLFPIRMVSEPVQLVLITRRYGVPFPNALATLVAGNVMDIFATVLLMGLGVASVSSLRGASIQLAGFIVLAVLALGIFIIVVRGLGAVPIARNMRFFQQIAIAVGVLKETPRRLGASFLATAASWGLLGLSGWVLAQGLGINVNPLTMAIVLVAATFVMATVPSLPAGIGTYHWAVVYTLGLLGVASEPATAFAVIMHLLVFCTSTGIAVAMLMRVGTGVLLRRSDLPAAVPAGASGPPPQRE